MVLGMRAHAAVPSFTLAIVFLCSPALHALATDAPSGRSRRVGRRLLGTDVVESAPAGRYAGVAASARSAAVVIWNERELLRSTDGGRTFGAVLAGDGRLVSVALDDSGEVLAIRGHAPPSNDPNVLLATARTVTEPPVRAEIVLAAGPHIVVVGHAPGSSGDRPDVAARSSDHGRTWRTDAIGSWGNFGNQLGLETDGTLRHAWGTEAACGGGMQAIARLGPSASEWQNEQWSLDAPVTIELGSRGWAYALDDGCGERDGRERLCAVSAGRVVGLGAPLEHDAWRSWAVVTNGRVTLATLQRRLLRLDGASARTIVRDVPPGFELSAVDSRGRALGMLRGRVVRGSARDGWRVIAE